MKVGYEFRYYDFRFFNRLGKREESDNFYRVRRVGVGMCKEEILGRNMRVFRVLEG